MSSFPFMEGRNLSLSSDELKDSVRFVWKGSKWRGEAQSTLRLFLASAERKRISIAHISTIICFFLLVRVMGAPNPSISSGRKKKERRVRCKKMTRKPAKKPRERGEEEEEEKTKHEWNMAGYIHHKSHRTSSAHLFPDTHGAQAHLSFNFFLSFVFLSLRVLFLF